jgi:hypothetical protein
MEQVMEALMEGAVLETPEFAYLLATLHATSLVGVVDADLFPADKATQATTYQEGLDKLKEHGWVTPIENAPNEQYNLNSRLLYLASVVAEPEFVVFTIRSSPSGQQVFLHYLAGEDIVELTVAEEREYKLLAIPGRLAMLDRLKELLGLPEVKAAPAVEFTIDESVFFTLQDLAEHGQLEEAAALLKEHVPDGVANDSLLDALQAADSGSLVVVVRPQDGEIVAGRKATVFHLPAVTWLARRVGAETNTLKVETVQAETLQTVLDNYLEYLSK